MGARAIRTPRIEALRRYPGPAPGWAIVDVGSGTGLSADLFLRHSYEVHAVEPNAAMRQAAERRLGHYAGFHSVDGRAEATTLPDASADAIVCASAFHWFDGDSARAEFRRVLRPGGFAVVMRNGRSNAGSPFMREYAGLFQRYAAHTGAHRNREERLREFFAGREYHTATAEYREAIGFDVLSRRILSYSTIPLPGQPGHADPHRQFRPRAGVGPCTLRTRRPSAAAACRRVHEADAR